MSNWELVGRCPVDSGQILLIDPCYVLADHNLDEGKAGAYYEKVCKVTIAEQAGEVIGGLGVATSTGWGDGHYPVYAKMDGGRVAEIKIKFM